MISKKEITNIARSTGFETHSNSKIRAHKLLLSFFLMVSLGQKSYSSWASSLASEIGKTVSKQAVFKRMNQSWVALLKLLVEKVLEKHLVGTKKKPACKLFKNIYLHDSTTLALPDFMRYLFPGNYSRGKQKAVAKINTIVNATTGLCSSFSIDSYTTPEQRLSENILNIAKAGDLVIRDLGYYALQVFRQMSARGIFFISRQLYQVVVFNPKTGQKLSLAKLLKNKSYIDTKVLCGSKQKLQVRLIAIKLCSKAASERIRKARKDRNKRFNHSADYYARLHYMIFITNIEESVCSPEQIAEFYRLRWQIEILFKSWKSGIKIETLLPEAQYKPERIESVIYMMMLYIAWYEQKIVQPINFEISKKRLNDISPIKLTLFVLKYLNYFFTYGFLKKDIKEIAYFCSYEKRHRTNAKQRLVKILNEFG